MTGSAKITAPEPRVGQVWISNDRRDAQLERPVIEVDERYVTLGGAKTTRVLRSRMRPISTGYRFVRDA
jgi:hypothetical protein